MSGIVKRIKCLGADEAPLWQSNIFFFSDDASEKDIKDFLLRYVESLFTTYQHFTTFRLYRVGAGYRLDYARTATFTGGGGRSVEILDSYGYWQMHPVTPELSWLADNVIQVDLPVSERSAQARRLLETVFFPSLFEV